VRPQRIGNEEAEPGDEFVEQGLNRGDVTGTFSVAVYTNHPGDAEAASFGLASPGCLVHQQRRGTEFEGKGNRLGLARVQVSHQLGDQPGIGGRLNANRGEGAQIQRRESAARVSQLGNDGWGDVHLAEQGTEEVQQSQGRARSGDVSLTTMGVGTLLVPSQLSEGINVLLIIFEGRAIQGDLAVEKLVFEFAAVDAGEARGQGEAELSGREQAAGDLDERFAVGHTGLPEKFVADGDRH
jgi:hypothetical protein